MGLRGRSLGPGWDSPGGGVEQKLPHGLTEGCFSQRERHQSGVLQQREVEVWGRMRKEGWSDNYHRDGCGKEARLDLSQLAHGSSLSGAEVKEYTSPPYCQPRGCPGPSHALCHEGFHVLSHGRCHHVSQHCICLPQFCTHHFPG